MYAEGRSSGIRISTVSTGYSESVSIFFFFHVCIRYSVIHKQMQKGFTSITASRSANSGLLLLLFCFVFFYGY